MKIKVRDFAEKLDALSALATKKLPPYPTAYRVGRAIKSLHSATNEVNAVHRQLVIKFGAADEKNKNQYKVLPENEVAFNAEFSPILDSIVEVNMPTVDIAELGNETIEPTIIAALLDWFILDRSIPQSIPADAANS